MFSSRSYSEEPGVLTQLCATNATKLVCLRRFLEPRNTRNQWKAVTAEPPIRQTKSTTKAPRTQRSILATVSWCSWCLRGFQKSFIEPGPIRVANDQLLCVAQRFRCGAIWDGNPPREQGRSHVGRPITVRPHSRVGLPWQPPVLRATSIRLY